ncbi:hypothetical protein AB0F03_35035 [Streptomyces sp. NPDC028722]|uniref:hypothetical protein n=1 Tax=Streptomyces sp. NPDC028722 TaxID=3155016 RepID=UPI0033CEF282
MRTTAPHRAHRVRTIAGRCAPDARTAPPWCAHHRTTPHIAARTIGSTARHRARATGECCSSSAYLAPLRRHM